MTEQPTPALLFETLNAHQRTAALKAAIELDVFTAIGEGLETAAALAKRRETSERGMRILCDYLAVVGFLNKKENRYALTPDSEMFLDRRSRAYFGTAAQFLLAPLLMDAFQDVAATVRKGGTVMAEQGTLAREHPIWVEFARAMSPMAAFSAELMAKLLGADSGRKWKVLDIAAGHGMFGITLAKHNRNAEIVAVDWPNVLAVARENAEAAGVTERYRTIPGSAFEVDFGEEYDLALLTNFLHHFDAPTCEKMLRKIRAALNAEGSAVTLEFVPNDDRISPPVAATFSLIMLASTPAGDAYTFSEFQRMFQNAGFSSSELHTLPPSFQQVIISDK